VCEHLPQGRTVAPTSRRCVACDQEGLDWVSLRVCLTCGEVGCCDNSVGRHATSHHQGSGHEVITSAEPGELWQWCFVHELTVEP
jgi:uncharacterized UBP type Zn finger protein